MSPILKVTCWNVNGIFKRSQDYSKLDDTEFLKCISEYDIIGILETHSSHDDIMNLQGFRAISFCRPKASLARKPSGGITVFYKSHISGIKVVKIAEHAIWIKLQKQNFHLTNDVYLAFSYLPPENSSFSQKSDNDILNAIEEDLLFFCNKGDIILMGDLNARTSTESEVIVNDTDKFLPNYVNYEEDLQLLPRMNQDETSNTRGKALIELCTATGLRILNGRKPGDSLGYFTCHKYNGSSTVDYGMCSESLFDLIPFFHVHTQRGCLADHCQISLGLMVKHLPLQPKSKLHLSDLPPSFKWTEESASRFQQALCNPLVQHQLSSFNACNFEPTEDGVDNATHQLSNIILAAADASVTRLVPKTRSCVSKKRNRWFNPELYKLRREVNRLGALLRLYPKDAQIRGAYHKHLREYRKRCKTEHRKFKAALIEKLDNLSENDPKAYWRLVNELCEKKKVSHPIDPDNFFKHYQSLNTDQRSPNCSDSETYRELLNMEDLPNFTELDFRITESETRKAILLLKNRKSVGLDLIQNEMIKHGISCLLAPLTKLFNLVLNSGHYPVTWAKGRIISLHKKGDASDPSNFRGITISSCVGKLFNNILNKRLNSFLENNHLLRDEQIGFRKNHRTSDHMFILKTLIEKYKKNKKPLYIGFVDFMKAFDTVWHQGLLFKILKTGISRKFYDVIKSMYSKVSLTVQIGDKITPFFTSTVGVRQGDNLSPSLFNIFVNNFPQIFDNKCLSPKFGNLTISCLLFADDLLVFSESKEGFQHALNKLHDYCNKWHLSVNIDKTQYMCIGCTEPSVILYNNSEIKRVTSYKYLGLNFMENGKMADTKREAFKKTLKVYFKLVKSLQPKPRSSTLIHLFDHLVKPVMNYGCEIWFPGNLELKTTNRNPTDNAATFFQNLKISHPIPSKLMNKEDCMEKLHLRFLRFCLGVHSKASNLAVYGDLGRYPMYVDQCIQTLKYQNYILHGTDNKLLKCFFNNLTSEKSQHSKPNLFRFTQQFEEIFGVSVLNSKRNHIFSHIKKKLHTDFTGYWSTLVNNTHSNSKSKGGNKLRTYKLFKTIFKKEVYTDLPDPNIRKRIAQIRTSAHKLKIESDRYCGKNSYIPPDKRLCTSCNLGVTEDEKHFLLECPAHQVRREALFSAFSNNNPHFLQYNKENKFFWLMSSENVEDVKHLGIFVNESFQARH